MLILSHWPTRTVSSGQWHVRIPEGDVGYFADIAHLKALRDRLQVEIERAELRSQRGVFVERLVDALTEWRRDMSRPCPVSAHDALWLRAEATDTNN